MNTRVFLPVLALGLAACLSDATERGTDLTSQVRARANAAQAETPAQVEGRMRLSRSIKLSPDEYPLLGSTSHRIDRAIDGASWQEAHTRVQAIFTSLPESNVATSARAAASITMLWKHLLPVESREQAEAVAVYVETISAVPGVQAELANRALLAAEPYLDAERFHEVARRLVAASDALDAENAAATTPPRPLTPGEQRDEAERVQTLDALRARLAG